MLYVDRLDSRTNSYSHHSAVQGLCDVLGPGVWLNTILVFTHAGAAPPPGMAAGSGGSQGPAHAALSYEDWMEGRSHALQVCLPGHACVSACLQARLLDSQSMSAAA